MGAFGLPDQTQPPMETREGLQQRLADALSQQQGSSQGGQFGGAPGSTLQSAPQPTPQLPLEQPQQQTPQQSQGIQAPQISGNGSGVKSFLGNFFSQAGTVLMHDFGMRTEQDKKQIDFRNQMLAQQSNTALQAASAAADYHRTLAAAMMTRANAAETGAENRDTSTTLTPEQAQAIGHPELAGSNVPKPLMDALTKQGIAADTNQTRQDISANTIQSKEKIASEANATRMRIMQRTLAQKAAMAGTGGTPTAQRANKADLAVNMQQNVNDMKSLIDAEPELFGKIAGRYTSIQQMIGSDDQHISVLGIAAHNAALANNSIHGIRSAEGAKATEQAILNGFKNGPAATKATMDEMARSASTFIDAARLGKAAPPATNNVVRWGRDGNGNPVRLK